MWSTGHLEIWNQKLRDVQLQHPTHGLEGNSRDEIREVGQDQITKVLSWCRSLGLILCKQVQ